MIYRKSLVVSRNKTINGDEDSDDPLSTGEVSNLVSVDAESALTELPWALHIWAGPLTVVVAVIFLWIEVGVAALAGVVFLFMLVPLNYYGNKKNEEYQVQ